MCSHDSPVTDVGTGVTAIAEASLEAALGAFGSALPLAVIALGRFGGAELSYASDLDVVFVYEGSAPSDFEEATRLAMDLRRFVAGATPAERIWTIDLDLRPEGKQGPVARSVEGYAAYFHRWAHVWERQAMLRARPVAGDPDVGQRFMALLEEFVWEPGLSVDDVREIRRIKARIERERIPPGEDPAFHLKLGRGSLSDIEWTVQLLQLRWGVRSVVHDGRARSARRPWRGRAAGRRPARHGVPVLRGDPQPALPRGERSGRRPAPAGVGAAALARPFARDDAVAAARGLPAGHPQGPPGDGAPVLRELGLNPPVCVTDLAACRRDR